MQAKKLKVSHLVNPLGIDIKKPLLTWTAENGIRQTAYQLTAFCDGETIWDTGKQRETSCRGAMMVPRKVVVASIGK